MRTSTATWTAAGAACIESMPGPVHAYARGGMPHVCGGLGLCGAARMWRVRVMWYRMCMCMCMYVEACHTCSLYSRRPTYYHILPHTTAYYHLLPLTTTYYHLLPLATPYYHVLPLTTTYYPLLPLTTTHYHLLLTTTHYHSLPPTAHAYDLGLRSWPSRSWP